MTFLYILRLTRMVGGLVLLASRVPAATMGG